MDPTSGIPNRQHHHPTNTIIEWELPLPPPGITVVSGSPGSGKTTLLAQWFQRLVALGLPPLCLRGNGRITDDDVLNRVGTRALLIDDADRLQPGVLDAIVDGVGRTGDSPVVISGRTPVGPALDRLGCEPVSFIADRDLALGDEAVAQILISHCPGLGDPHLDSLIDKVDGWAFGAQLAGRVAAAAPDPDLAVEDFSGRNPLVSDYLEAEIYAGLDHPDQEFLAACSVLSELTPDGCMLLTGDRNSANRLARFSASSGLITEHAGAWRWRALAREFLASKLDLHDPTEVAELRRRARGWSAARHSWDEAVGQGLAATDWNAVVGLVLEVGPEVVANGGGARVLSWLSRLPQSIIGQEPGLAAVASMALWALEGDDAKPAIVDWLAMARRVGNGRPPTSAPSASAAISVVDAAFSPAGPGQRLELARSALGHVAESPPWRALACWTIGMAAYFDDDPRTSCQALTDYLEASNTAGLSGDTWLDPRLTTAAIGTLALIELDADCGDRATILISTVGLGADRSSSPAIGPFELARARRDLDESSDGDELADLQRLGCTAMVHEIRILAHLELARAYADRELLSRRREHLAEADRLLRSMISPGRLLARKRNAAEHQVGPTDDGGASGGTLTEREVEILLLLESDLSRRQIADNLYLAHNTVKTYVQRIYRKLGVSSRAAAVARGRERGWIS